MIRALSICLLQVIGTGCAVQATYGYAWPERDVPQLPRAVRLDARMMDTRAPSVLAGLSVTGEGRDDALRLRRGTVVGGYQWPAIFESRFSVEPALELGFGSPVEDDYARPGVYLGGTADVLFRIVGEDRTTAAFQIVGMRLDLVAHGGGGTWTPPEGSGLDATGEASAMLGLRGIFSTDIGRSNPTPSGNARSVGRVVP